jgi:hypothetical protein
MYYTNLCRNIQFMCYAKKRKTLKMKKKTQSIFYVLFFATNMICGYFPRTKYFLETCSIRI